MLEKPTLQDEKVVAGLHDDYGLRAIEITFLPLGADRYTAVYHIVTNDETPYFLKLRGGVFDETSVMLPKVLSDQGIKQIIPPVPTKTGQFWANLAAFKVILYPFIEGKNGYEVQLTDKHWAEFGTALKRIHKTALPPALIKCIRQETYSAKWRNIVKHFLERLKFETFTEPIALELAAFLQQKQNEILDLVGQADRLAQILLDHSREFIVCHSDLHAGNILIDTHGAFYIVDWDEPIRAPKERDLMYIGGGLLASGQTPQAEEARFYPTYGQTEVDQVALAYYRYERIVQDIAVYCQELLLTDEGGPDRAQSLYYLKSNFLSNHTIEIAYQSDRTVR